MHSQHACCACICHATITSLNAQCFVFFPFIFKFKWGKSTIASYYSKVPCCQLVSACITSIKHFFPARSTNSKQQPPTMKPDISTEVFNSDENHWYKTEAVMGPVHGIQKLINTWMEYLWYECKRKLFLTFSDASSSIALLTGASKTFLQSTRSQISPFCSPSFQICLTSCLT